MPELVWIVDPATGDLVVEGLATEAAVALAGDLLPAPHMLNCAQPLATVPLPTPRETAGDAPALRVAALWHGSVVEGPGRRSVLQVQGCPLRCSARCFVPATHDLEAGVVLPVDTLVDALLDPAGAPRDGISVLGGEPFGQPAGLAALLRRFKRRGLHTTVYTGYTLATLGIQPGPRHSRSSGVRRSVDRWPVLASAGRRRRRMARLPQPAPDRPSRRRTGQPGACGVTDAHRPGTRLPSASWNSYRPLVSTSAGEIARRGGTRTTRAPRASILVATK